VWTKADRFLPWNGGLVHRCQSSNPRNLVRHSVKPRLVSVQQQLHRSLGFNVVNDETADAIFTALDGGSAFDLTGLSYMRTSWGSCECLPSSPQLHLLKNDIRSHSRESWKQQNLPIGTYRTRYSMGCREQAFTYGPSYTIIELTYVRSIFPKSLASQTRSHDRSNRAI
jgi:hypothetical protein